MNGRRPKLRLLLDEGVPVEVGRTFEARGHEVIQFGEALSQSASDTLVARTAEANEAILVAFDRDMRQIARTLGISNSRFKRLSLIHLQCPEPMAAKRLQEAMSFVEHEWSVATTKRARRLHVEIGMHVLRSYR